MLNLIIYKTSLYSARCYSGTHVAQGRWASSLFQGCFGLCQNLLRMILTALAFARHRPQRGPSTGTDEKMFIKSYSFVSLRLKTSILSDI